MTFLEKNHYENNKTTYVLGVGVLAIWAIVGLNYHDPNQQDKCISTKVSVIEDSLGEAVIQATPNLTNNDQPQSTKGYITGGLNQGEQAQQEAQSPGSVLFKLDWNKHTLFMPSTNIQINTIPAGSTQAVACPDMQIYINPHSFNIYPK